MKENEQEQLIKAAEILYKDNKVTASELWYDVVCCKQNYHYYVSYYCLFRNSWDYLKKLKLI